MILSKFIANCVPENYKVSILKIFDGMKGIRAEVTVRLIDMSERSESHTYWLNSRETDLELDDIMIAIVSIAKGLMDTRVASEELRLRDW